MSKMLYSGLVMRFKGRGSNHPFIYKIRLLNGDWAVIWVGGQNGSPSQHKKVPRSDLKLLQMSVGAYPAGSVFDYTGSCQRIMDLSNAGRPEAGHDQWADLEPQPEAQPRL